MTLTARILCTALLVSTAGLLLTYAQTEKNQPLAIRGGLVAGLNASQVDGDDYAGYFKAGLNGGFYGQIPLGKWVFLATEILYSQQGAKSRTIPGVPLPFLSRFHYASIPVLINYQDKEAFYFGAGFMFSRLVRQRIFFDRIEQPPASICSSPPDDVSLLDPQFICLRRNDFLVVAEGNYLFNKNFGMNVRFSYSLWPMGYYGSSNFPNRGMYNNVLSFRLRYIFGG